METKSKTQAQKTTIKNPVARSASGPARARGHEMLFAKYGPTSLMSDHYIGTNVVSTRWSNVRL